MRSYRPVVLAMSDQLLWLIDNILFCYDGEKHTGNDSERKQQFLQHKVKHSNNKEAYTNGLKSTGKKVGFAPVFADIQVAKGMGKQY